MATAFDDLCERMVFVGGAIVDFLITDPLAPHVRPTMDVDVIIELMSQIELHELQNILRARGFREDTAGSRPLICSWNINGVRVDILPTDEAILGFSNRWFAQAFRKPVWFDVDDRISIRLIAAPNFLATKFAAFGRRGKQDYMGSPDLEDIVAVLDGRPSIVAEIADSDATLVYHLMNECKTLIGDHDFLDFINNYSMGDLRIDLVVQRLTDISKLR